MDILKKVLGTSNGNSNDKICMTTKVDRNIARQFKVVASALGKTQKELVENYLQQIVVDYKAGRLQ